jgi:dienelactone hydrolase
LDAYGAKQYLSDLSFVDPGRIAVMGMSHGAMTVLEVVRQSTLSGQSLSPFRAAVAYYPLCGQPESLNAPTLVLVGEKDTWTPAQQCVQYLHRMEQPHELVLKVFTDAYHLFDHPEIDLKELGHTLRSDPEAAAQAILITKEFLGDHL